MSAAETSRRIPPFTARIGIIGVNPYMIPPAAVLAALFARAGRESGPIPVRGTLNGHRFIQTLVKFKGRWRLYLNTPMRRAAGLDVGDTATVRLSFDPRKRTVRMPALLGRALMKNPAAKKVFDSLSPSRQKEINRYIQHLKTDDVRKKNVARALRFLRGKGPFAGRKRP